MMMNARQDRMLRMMFFLHQQLLSKSECHTRLTEDEGDPATEIAEVGDVENKYETS
jgi:hypothetical protein